MNYVFAAPPAISVPVAGTDRTFPVHRIYCVGRNYVEHKKEMGFTDRDPPFFFMKPADAVVAISHGAVGEIPYPSATQNFHHEIELVVAIGNRGRNIPVEDAPGYVFGYAVGLDMTRRDLQFAMRDKGRPWDVSKGFDHSAPIAPIHPLADVGDIAKAAIALDVNGATRQSSSISKLIWNVAETIAHLSTYFELVPGDLIFTGTPEGVGAVVSGDLLEGRIDGLGDLRVRIA